VVDGNGIKEDNNPSLMRSSYKDSSLLPKADDKKRKADATMWESQKNGHSSHHPRAHIQTPA
jgi:hypothetical protein